MANVGTAYISVVPSMKGAAASITKQLGGIDVSGVGRRMGGQISAGASKGVSALSGKMSVLAGAVGGAAASITGSLIGAVASLGSEMASASDSAQKFASTLSFAGIDDSTVKQLTASTQEYADRTVYDLADIRNATAQLAANGVNDYAQLAEAAGNLNAVAGGNADTFKSVSMVMSQTAGSGRLMTENWNQLTDAIPGASGALQDAMREAGAFEGNFREAMEKGEISADEFFAAVQQLGMTDVAKEAATSTATIEGAMGNLQASVVGVGAQAIDAIKPMLTGAIGGISSFVSGIPGKLAPIGAALGTVGDSFSSAFSEAAPAIEQAGAAVSELSDGAIAALADVISTHVAPAVGELGQFIATTVVPAVQQLAQWLSDNAVPALQEMSAWMSENTVPIFQQLGEIVATQVVPTLQQVAQWISENVVPALQQLWDYMASNVLPIMTDLAAWISGAVVPALSELWTWFSSNILPILQAVWDILSVTLFPALAMLGELIFGTVVPALQEAYGWFSANIIPVIRDAGSVISGAIAGFAAFASGVKTNIGQAKESVSSGIEEIKAFFRDLPGNILSALGDLGNLLWTAGTSIVKGLLDGIKSAIGDVYGFVSGIGEKIASLKGPIPYDLKLLVPNGIAIMEGLRSGIGKGLVGVLSDVGDIAPAVVREMGAVDAAVDVYGRGGVPVARASVASSASERGGRQSDVVAWLGANLPRIIAECTPVMGESDLDRRARKAVRYAV